MGGYIVECAVFMVGVARCVGEFVQCEWWRWLDVWVSLCNVYGGEG